jgi:hypothetical protein
MSAATRGSESGAPEAAPPVPTYAVPPPREVGELIYVFRRDLAHLRTAIEAERESPTSNFVTAGWTCVGIVVTAALGLAGYYASDPSPEAWMALLMWALGAAAVASGFACFIAARYFRAARVTVRGAVISELDRLEYRSPVLDETQFAVTAGEGSTAEQGTSE